MILNGSLRDLEVWVRRFHLFSGESENRMGFKEGEAVERLMGVLKDPYLERVVLKTYMERRHIPPTYQSDTLPDVTSFIDKPVEDVTKLISGRGRDYQMVITGQVRKIRMP